MITALILTHWKAVLAVVVAFGLGWAITAPGERSAGREEGRTALLAEQAVAAAANERKRITDDARLSNLSDRALCERSLRGRGMPVDACAGL